MPVNFPDRNVLLRIVYLCFNHTDQETSGRGRIKLDSCNFFTIIVIMGIMRPSLELPHNVHLKGVLQTSALIGQLKQCKRQQCIKRF